ncbi:MAG TPA: hypothetical protein VE912_06605 [Bacteroidales bacterium]|nr:hypothetical protein [Bacteroidales bacterium]
MKRIIILTGALLIAATVSSQTTRRAGERNNQSQTEAVKAKKETNKETPSRTKRSRTFTPSEQVNTNNRNNSRKNTPSVRREVPSRDRNNTQTVVPASRRGGNTRSYSDDHRSSDRRVVTGNSNSSTNHGYRSGNYNGENYYSSRHEVHVHRHVSPPRSIEYRRRYYPYRSPVHISFVWTPEIRREYTVIYPEHRWRYEYGMNIRSISAYDAGYYVGDLVRVYGRVEDVYYSPRTDDYFLYFGARFPYQDFSVVLPGREARNISRHPERFFERNYVWVTGIISTYENVPEIVIRKGYQIGTY